MSRMPSSQPHRPARARRLLCLLAATLGLGLSLALHAGGFEVVALGVEGGLDDGNLSAYLLRRQGDRDYLALDAGTLLPGIRQALRRGAFDGAGGDDSLAAAGRILRQSIAGYFISHAHLDHVAGLLIASPDDTGHKPVYALPDTLDALSRDYFNWSAWPNLSDRGAPPALGRYLLTAEPAGRGFAIAGTSMQATLYPLAHDRVVSSMLLACSAGACLAYFGDTGPDALAHGDRLAAVWRALAPLVRRHALDGIVIEISYPDDVPDGRLYGHLTPRWLLRELGRLQQMAGGAGSLRGLPVAIVHVKPSLEAGRHPRALIAAQLQAGNRLGVRFMLPRQGDLLRFPDVAAEADAGPARMGSKPR